MNRLLWLLGLSFFVVGDGAKKPPAVDPNEPLGFSRTASFKPGKLGIGADWGKGTVTRIDKGGQGQRNGVEVNDIIKKVDEKNYHESLLDKRLAGKLDFDLTFFRPPPQTTTTTTPGKDDLPPIPDYEYATELDPKSFKDLVYMVANGTDAVSGKSVPYYPVVMFHVSWCKHCRHALPEIEKAAKMVEEDRLSGKSDTYNPKSKQHDTFPKFFVFECDKPAEHVAVCEEYVGGNYPVIRAFRDQRSILFNRPRIAQTFAWWAMHVTRQPLIKIKDPREVIPPEMAAHAPLWLLHADPSKDAATLQAWKDVALDKIDEDHAFAFVEAGSKASSKVPAAPSVSVNGKGLEPLPFEDFDFTRQSITDWVNFNQFAAVAELSPYSESALRKSGFVVVTLMYDGRNLKSKAREEFAAKAKQLRLSRQFLFAEINVQDEEHFEYMQKVFPLLSPTYAWASPPHIFAFEGKDTYWEDPDSLKFSSELTIESIGKFIAHAENRQDKTTASWLKEKMKLFTRFARGSTTGTVVCIGLMLAVIAGINYLIVPCIQGLFSSDEESDKKKD